MTQTTEPPPADADIRSLAFFEHYYCIALRDGSTLHDSRCCTVKIREAAQRELAREPKWILEVPAVAEVLRQYGPIDR